MGTTSAVRRAGGVIAALALVLTLVGCRPPAGLVGSYRVTGLYSAEQVLVPVLPGTTITLQFTADGRVSGKACNSYGGSWTVAAGRNPLTIGNLYSTDMACSEPDGVMGQEQHFLGRLAQARNFTRQGTGLSLIAGGEPSQRLIEAEAV